jgi:hypothetical protein
MKYNLNKSQRVTKAFTNLYPNAKTHIISLQNFVDFAFLTNK